MTCVSRTLFFFCQKQFPDNPVQSQHISTPDSFRDHTHPLQKNRNLLRNQVQDMLRFPTFSFFDRTVIKEGPSSVRAPPPAPSSGDSGEDLAHLGLPPGAVASAAAASAGPRGQVPSALLKALVRTGISGPGGVPGKLTASTGGRGVLIFGDSKGWLHAVDRAWSTSSWQGYDKAVTWAVQVRGSGILLTVGDEEGLGDTAVVKLWNMDKADKLSGVPPLLRVIRLMNGKYGGVPVSAVTVAVDLSQMAVGFTNGAVVLVRGDLARDRYSKQKILIEPTAPPDMTPEESSKDHSVTGLHYRTTGSGSSASGPGGNVGAEVASPVSGKSVVYLYVVTGKRVMLADTTTTKSDSVNALVAASSLGNEARFGPSVVNDDGALVLSQPDGLYFYDPSGRGVAYGYENSKLRLEWFHGYLVLVSADRSGSAARASVALYDLGNKFAAYSGAFPAPIKHILPAWGSLFVVAGSGEDVLYQLEEKDTTTKLDLLFKRAMYRVALNMANSHGYERSVVTEIYRKYGDHLYGKGDYDGAMAQYLRTIGGLEPSYVIRKYLDAQRIHSLTSYLQSLHEQGLGNADHTTLLLNCYTKLKDTANLDEFLGGAATAASQAGSGSSFDVETAIRVCRQAGYSARALYLAAVHGEHEAYLDILMEDTHDRDGAAAYIASLDYDDAAAALRRHGKALMTAAPGATTAVLVALCTQWVPGPAPPMPLLPSGGGGGSGLNVGRTGGAVSGSVGPESLLGVFVDHPRELMIFLEAVTGRKGAATPSKEVMNTLFELYLRPDDGLDGDDENGVSAESRSQSRRAKAMALLRTPGIDYDAGHVLMLAKLHNVTPIVLYLYDALRLYGEIVQHYMDSGDASSVVAACKKYGPADPSLWERALAFFVNAVPEEGSPEAPVLISGLSHVLAAIDEGSLLPPLRVVQVLASNPNITLGTVKEYLRRRLAADQASLEAHSAAVAAATEETARMRTEMAELTGTAKVFQRNACSSCRLQLELPAVHYFCNHSFHQRCLNDGDDQCPLCGPEHRRIGEMKRATEAAGSAAGPGLRAAMDNSKDGFSVASEVFGQGMFNRAGAAIVMGAPAPNSGTGERNALFKQ